jgi:hypothetical protein
MTPRLTIRISAPFALKPLTFSWGYAARFAGEEIGFSRTLKRWGRARGLHFHVLDHAVPSSARKVEQFTVWQTLRQIAVCAWPGNLGRRDRLRFWYERPGDLPASP